MSIYFLYTLPVPIFEVIVYNYIMFENLLNNNNNQDGEREADAKHLRVPKKLYVKLIEYVRNNLDNMLSSTGKCIWYHSNYKSPIYDNLCFLYGNTIFSVLIEVIDANNTSYLRQEHIDNQFAVCKQYNFIPCKYPVVVPNPYDLNNVHIKPLYNGLNLIHTQTGEKIIPQNLITNEKVLMTDWELRHFCILYTAANLNSKGCRIARLQDMMGYDPQIWFYPPVGKMAWVIVRFETPNKKEEIDPTMINKILNQGFKNDGFLAELYISPDEGTEIYRNSNPNVKFTSFKNIHSIKDFENSGKNNIYEENVKKLVLSSISSSRISKGKHCDIYEIPNHNEYLLKIGGSYLSSLNEFPDNYRFVKVKYNNRVEYNRHFGLPIYALLPKDSPSAQMGYITPEEADADKDRVLQILRKVPGEQVGTLYRNFYLNLIGESRKFYAYRELSENMIEINSKYGEDSIKTVFSKMAKGQIKLKPNEIAQGSKSYKFVDPQKYESGYKIFVTHYLGNLFKLAELPQETYNHAIENLLSPKDFTFDFNHPQNTFIDYNKKEFYFIDFVYDKQTQNQIETTNIIENFRNTLLGKNIHLKIQPKDLLFYNIDKTNFNNLAATITSKINKAAPDNMKLTTDSY